MTFVQILKILKQGDAEEKSVTSKKFAFYNPENRSHAFYDLGPDIGAVSHIGNDIEISSE